MFKIKTKKLFENQYLIEGNDRNYYFEKYSSQNVIYYKNKNDERIFLSIRAVSIYEAEKIISAFETGDLYISNAYYNEERVMSQYIYYQHNIYCVYKNYDEKYYTLYDDAKDILGFDGKYLGFYNTYKEAFDVILNGEKKND